MRTHATKSIKTPISRLCDHEENSVNYLVLSMEILTVFLLTILTMQFSAGLPTDLHPNAEQQHLTRMKRSDQKAAASNVLSGLAVTQSMLISCVKPTLLPEVSNISKWDCDSVPRGINSAYEELISALDKILRLYDLKEKLSSEEITSIETRALYTIIETVINQTCQWV